MKHSKFKRSLVNRGIWCSFRSKEGKAVLKDLTWRRWLNWNGIAFNLGEHAHYFEFRRYKP